VSEQTTFAPRSILLPAVLQVAGQSPCFGTIASLTKQGLAFDFQNTPLPQQSVGLTARLDFDLNAQHHSSKGLIVNIQGRRALLSLRNTSMNVLAALQSVNREGTHSLATRLSSLQVQQACHTQFMGGMRAVVDDFFLLLPEQVQLSPRLREGLVNPTGLAPLQKELIQLRPRFIQQFTLAYPMYPEPGPGLVGAPSAHPTDAAEMESVDDWIRRTTIAQNAGESISPLPDEFSRHYSSLLNSAGQHTDHPFQLDAVLNVLVELIAPLKLDLDQRVFCYELMGRAFQKHAAALYHALLGIVGDAPPEFIHHPQQITSLEAWLKLSAADTARDAEGGNTSTDAAAPARINELAALLNRLTENLGEANAQLPASASPYQDGYLPASILVSGMLARDRIFSRFLPATGMIDTAGLLQGNPAPPQSGTESSAVGQVLGGLGDLDNAAMQGLYALMRQPPPVDLGPEKLAQASQIRALMLQAQGLLLEYTLNGLTYHAQPEHPAWTLINALDALHQGVDDRGQFLDPALHHAVNLTMQWLLGQENADAALIQVNRLLLKINSKLREDRQSRRSQRVSALGPLVSEPSLDIRWCVVKRDEEAIPYEVLGLHEDKWVLLNRSATGLLEIPADRFLRELDSGLIEEAQSFDEPFLERIADATLTASLDAVHAYTWQDPASGCLKRNALMDELERRLAHPVSEPSTFCALIEIPTMRPSLSSLPGDELTVMQKRTGEILLAMMDSGEHCGRLSDVTFLMIFSPQDPDQLAGRLTRLKTDLEDLHPEWKVIGAVVPLIDGKGASAPSSVLRRANQLCASARQHAGFDLSCLSNVPSVANQINPLPFSSLYLRCQKIASCEDGAPSHYEILLGIHEELVPSHTTQSFVVMAEQTGRIHDLDTWVLKSALKWMDSNPAGLNQLSGLSVNLSGSSLTMDDHVDAMVGLLSDYPHLTKKLIIEVTETAAIGCLDVAVRSLRKLRKLGCRVALDDFGSGYSSYGYLRSLPLDYLKIDGIYIRNILTDKTDQALTASMVDVAHALGLKVIAEYVENEAIYSCLKTLGVDYVQGYWVHKPERLDGLILN